MKCAYHPAVDSTGVCASCGRPICANCMSVLDDSVCCEKCAVLKTVVKLPGARSEHVSGRSGLATAAAIMSIVMGIALLLVVMMGLIGVLNILGQDKETGGSAAIISFIALSVVGTALIAFGYYGLTRR